MSAQILKDIAYVRSGDKGSTISIGVIAKERRFYEPMCAAISTEAVKRLFGEWVGGEVEIHYAENIHSLLIHMKSLKDGGATSTLRYDATGKALGTAVLRLPVEVNE